MTDSQEMDEGPANSRDPCTLENCGHMRQLDAIVDFLGMTRGACSVLDWLRSRASQGVTVEAFIEHVELVRQRAGGASIAKAFLVLSDDADGHEFKVAVPREFALAVGKHLKRWDEADESPRISITFTFHVEAKVE